jgi:hypothetical protein
MSGPSYIVSPQTREYLQSNGLTNKPFRTPREQEGQKMAVVEKEKEVAQLDSEDPDKATSV